MPEVTVPEIAVSSVKMDVISQMIPVTTVLPTVRSALDPPIVRSAYVGNTALHVRVSVETRALIVQICLTVLNVSLVDTVHSVSFTVH